MKKDIQQGIVYGFVTIFFLLGSVYHLSSGHWFIGIAFTIMALLFYWA